MIRAAIVKSETGTVDPESACISMVLIPGVIVCALYGPDPFLSYAVTVSLITAWWWAKTRLGKAKGEPKIPPR